MLGIPEVSLNIKPKCSITANRTFNAGEMDKQMFEERLIFVTV